MLLCIRKKTPISMKIKYFTYYIFKYIRFLCIMCSLNKWNVTSCSSKSDGSPRSRCILYLWLTIHTLNYILLPARMEYGYMSMKSLAFIIHYILSQVNKLHIRPPLKDLLCLVTVANILNTKILPLQYLWLILMFVFYLDKIFSAVLCWISGTLLV